MGGQRTKADYRRALELLERLGMLLLSDARLPSVATLVAGEPVKGSWWGHPRGHDIFRVAEALDAHPDITTAKLISSKVTFIYRALWSALVTVGSARERWQVIPLSPAAHALLQFIDKSREVNTNDPALASSIRGWRDAVRELEEKLLIHSEEFHTSTGAHAKRLVGWDAWSRRVGFQTAALSVDEAKQALENALHRINGKYAASGTLPWLQKHRV